MAEIRFILLKLRVVFTAQSNTFLLLVLCNKDQCIAANTDAGRRGLDTHESSGGQWILLVGDTEGMRGRSHPVAHGPFSREKVHR